MTASKENINPEWVDPDDAPDLSTPEWVARINSVPVTYGKPNTEAALVGRPKSPAPKQLTTLRLSPDILTALKASGKGWQTRVEEILRRELKL